MSHGTSTVHEVFCALRHNGLIMEKKTIFAYYCSTACVKLVYLGLYCAILLVFQNWLSWMTLLS